MAFSSSINILPSFKNHHDIEFCRQLLLNQIPNALYFFNPKSKIIHDFLIELLKLPGNDPIRDVPIILFKWSCKCFLNRIKPPKANPSVPLDFSFIHPELSNFNILYSYVSNENLADNFMRLNDTFPYELFKVISMMNPDNAQRFTTACGFNSSIPIHMSGRIISIFPLYIVTIDFSKLFLKRCNKSYDNFIHFFEGLLCNADFNLSQITAAQLLSDHFDDLLIERINNKSKNNINEIRNNQSLQLINTSIRKMTHFLDNNLALSMHLFPSQCTTLSFLLQASVAPFSTLAKAVKNLPPSEYITRFNNQMKLMQVVGLGEDWKKLEDHSLPYLIGSEQLSLVPVLLVDIPRTSRFLTLSTSDYQKDYDFIHLYLIIEDMIKNQKLKSKESLTSLLSISDSLFSSKSEDDFFSNLAIDIFSLLFLKNNKKVNYDIDKNNYYDILGRRKSSSLSEFDLNEKSSSFSKSGSTNYLIHSLNSEFVFDADTALSVVTILLSSEKLPGQLRPYLQRSLIRLRCSLSLFERPVKMEAVLLPQNYFYLHALESLELLEMLIKNFGNPPSFVLSRQFSLFVSKSLYLRDRSIGSKVKGNFNPFSDRITDDKPLKGHTEEIFDEILNHFPFELHSLILLDFVSSHKKFTIFASKNKDVNYSIFVQKLLNKKTRYPPNSLLSLPSIKSLDELQKKLCFIMSFKNSNKKNFLVTWCAFLFLLTSVPGQTFQKFLKEPVESQIIEVINCADTVQSAVEMFADTGIDVLRIIFDLKHSKLLKEKLILGLIKFDPILGIPFSLSIPSFNRNKVKEEIGKNESFKIVFKKLNRNKIQSDFDFLFEKDFDKFVKFFEDKIDLIINENKILPFLQKLDSVINSSNGFNIEKAMLILDYLIYKINLSPHFELILSIICHCPKDWSINYIESFVSLIGPSNELALFPLQQKLSELKPQNGVVSQTSSEALKVCTEWDYLIKEVTRFKNVIKQPEKFYRLCSLHLRHHEIGRSLITLVQLFTQILLFARSYRIFENGSRRLSNSPDKGENKSVGDLENEWVNKYLKLGISSLKESVLAEMTVDIGLNYCYECGLSISEAFNRSFESHVSSLPESAREELSEASKNADLKKIERISSSSLINFKLDSSISNSIKKELPDSVVLITFSSDPEKLADEILSEKVVRSVDDEVQLLHLLVKLKKFDFVKKSRLFQILDTFCHSSVFLRFGVEYSGRSLVGLRDVAERCDLMSSIDGGFIQSLFEGIEISEPLRKKLNDSYSIFGLAQKKSSLNKKLLFTSPSIDFNADSFLNDAIEFLNKKVNFEKTIQKAEKKEETQRNLSVKEIISFINQSSIQSFKTLSHSVSVPNLFSIEADQNSFSIFSESIQKFNGFNSSLNFCPDFRFFDIGCRTANGEAQLRISRDAHEAAMETIAFSEVGRMKRLNATAFVDREGRGEQLGDLDLLSALHEAVVRSDLFGLFDELSFGEMRRILEFANERSLIFILLQITVWVQEHQAFFGIFVFPGSELQSTPPEPEFAPPEAATAALNPSTTATTPKTSTTTDETTAPINSTTTDDVAATTPKTSTTTDDDGVATTVSQPSTAIKTSKTTTPNISTTATKTLTRNEKTTTPINSTTGADDVAANAPTTSTTTAAATTTQKASKANTPATSTTAAASKVAFGEPKQKSAPNVSFEAGRVLDFIFALKLTLISAMRVSGCVDPSSLLPPSVIRSGSRKRLDDLCLAVDHQVQIGVQNLNLFDETSSSGNVAHVIAQVFVNYSNEYDRGFALARVLHADIDEVMIEAAALVASKQNNSQEQLVQFLLAVLPRLNSRSSNQLIQALSSILVRNAENEHFLNLIVEGIDNKNSAYQMLRCFGYADSAIDFALLNDLGEEVEISMKDANKRGMTFAVRKCLRWIRQHKK